MGWQDISTYFSNIPAGFLENLLSHGPYPWSPLDVLTEHITRFFDHQKSRGTLSAERAVLWDANHTFIEGSYAITQTTILADDFCDVQLKIFIGAGTRVEAGAMIKDHTIIEPKCEIRQGAYIRGFAFIGEGSVVGHTTEIKNSIFIKHVEAGHFAYIGDTIIGSYVNLGAGTKISNLQFRSLKEKRLEQFPHITLIVENQKIETGRAKIGAIIGDGCETGCNSVLSPCVLLEPECKIGPNYCVAKGNYKRGKVLRNRPDKRP